MVMSSLNEISMGQLRNRVVVRGKYSALSRPFLQQAAEHIHVFKYDVNACFHLVY
jgi:hypothetical protein